METPSGGPPPASPAQPSDVVSARALKALCGGNKRVEGDAVAYVQERVYGELVDALRGALLRADTERARELRPEHLAHWSVPLGEPK